MSGDVRKRREKKRKKEDTIDDAILHHQHVAPPSAPPTDDVNIHVHKESTTGGGFCAKFVFFILLAILAVLIGLIITEHRGLTDLDTVDTDSRFSQIFDGWIEEKGHHDDHDDDKLIEQSEEAGSHEEDEEHSEHDDHDEEDHDDDHDEGHEDEDESRDEDEDEELSEEEKDTEEDASTLVEDESVQESVQDDDDEEESAADDDDESAQYDEESEGATQEESDAATQEESDAVTQEESDTATQEESDAATQEESDGGTQEDSQTATQEESDGATQEESDGATQEESDGDTLEDSEAATQEDSEGATQEEIEESMSKRRGSEDVDDRSAEDEQGHTPDEDQPGDSEAEEESQEVRRNESEELDDEDGDGDAKKVGPIKSKETSRAKRSREATSKAEDEEGTDTEAADAEGADQIPGEGESIGVAKVGVGVALLVVAYVVLVRKWKSDSDEPKAEKSEIPDLTRRNTIVPPPPLQQVVQEIENVEEDYSDEEGQESEEDEVKIQPVIKKKYQELRSTYTRTLTPESDEEVSRKPGYDYEEEENDIEYDDEEEEDQEEEQEDSDEDREFLKKLEAKYGKYNGSESEDEEEEDVEEREGNRGAVRRETKDVRGEAKGAVHGEGKGESRGALKGESRGYYEDDQEESDGGYEKEDEDREDDEDDFETWKRIKLSEDNKPESDDEMSSSYQFSNITNKGDFEVKDELDEADKKIHDNPILAQKLFENILKRKPRSPRAQYGIARCFERRVEAKPTLEWVYEAINHYLLVLRGDDVPDLLYEKTAESAIKQYRMLGKYNTAITVHQWLIERYPDEVRFKNKLVVLYLTINRIPEARHLLKEILLRWPNDGFALVHYGFVLKTADNDLTSAIDYLSRGIATRAEGVIDGRFYFHLGDAYARLGRKDQAEKVYEHGVEQKLFFSKYQRSLYNVDRLTGKPWWEVNETPYVEYFRSLEKHWREIRNEGLSVLNQEGYFKDESENLKDVGDWKQFELFARGAKNKENCEKCPFTCSVVETLIDARRCKRGQIKFSVMHPGTHVWPHCGPTNCRLRAHLGLKVPPNTFIRVGEETRSWKQGKVFIFDDSFEHEVWHNGTDFRLVLIVDVWHPELTVNEKRNLRPI